MGCLFRLVVLGLLAATAATVAGCVLATRPVGPTYDAGIFVYEANGARHEVRLTSEAARRFDDKLAGRLTPADLPDILTGGVVVTEQELNSRVAEELEARSLARAGGRVEHVFIRLTAEGARAYMYTRDGPFAVTLHGNLRFELGGGRLRVRIDDVHAGRLPIQPVVTGALRLLRERTAIEDAITVVIPPQVRAITVEEGRLRAVVVPSSPARRGAGIRLAGRAAARAATARP